MRKHILYMSTQDTPRRTTNSASDYLALGEFFRYFIRVFKKDPMAKGNFNLKAMHTINKISIVMFVLGVLSVIIKFALR